MATISRYSAVMQVPVPGFKKPFETEGYFAWLGWLALHLVYLVGFRNRLNTLINWFFAFTTKGRSQLAVTEQQVYARTAIGQLTALEKQAAERNGTGSDAAAAKTDSGTVDSATTDASGTVPTEGKDAAGKESEAAS